MATTVDVLQTQQFLRKPQHGNCPLASFYLSWITPPPFSASEERLVSSGVVLKWGNNMGKGWWRKEKIPSVHHLVAQWVRCINKITYLLASYDYWIVLRQNWHFSCCFSLVYLKHSSSLYYLHYQTLHRFQWILPDQLKWPYHVIQPLHSTNVT